MKGRLLWLPLAGFMLLLVVVGIGLYAPADRVVRSRLVGKAMPVLALPAAVAGKPGVATDTGRGPRLVNVFASWCVPCAAEAPQLAALRDAGVRVEGVAVRDAPADLRRFLDRYGDPFAAIGDDRQGRFQFAIGSSGVPESFVVDARGRIVLQHVGDIRAEDVPGLIAAVRAAA